jgi:hypothetical protein
MSRAPVIVVVVAVAIRTIAIVVATVVIVESSSVVVASHMVVLGVSFQYRYLWRRNFNYILR